MKQKWGREKDSGKWPSDKPLWAIGAFFVALTTVIAIGFYRYQHHWTPLQRFYFADYVWTQLASHFQTAGHYGVLTVVTRKGAHLALDWEAQLVIASAGKPDFVLTEAARKAGALKLEWQPGDYDNRKLHYFLAHWIYQDQSLFDLAKPSLEGGLAMLILGLMGSIPIDAAREKDRKHGRRLKGPERVSPRAFNRRMRSDGIGFVQQRTFLDMMIFRRRCVRLPRELESSHFLVIGDSGKGKSSLIRQILLQIERRDETAIVYDPASPADYTPYIYTPSRGDLILNPLDQRMPYWTLGDELRQGADALALAASLFPDRPNENSFFFEAPRKIFAYLLSFHPSPQQLVWWMSHPEEIDRLVKGTELEAMIGRDSPAQRNGVLGSLNLVADAMRLLPSEAETERRWSTLEWSKHRRGWLFITSTPDTRKRLAPLISLWLDTLVLRLMNQGQTGKRPVWFILDELASLQRLPQLHTAITENRKSNNPVILSFQGRSQLEARYGYDAEAMISQPATKVFLATSEPRAAKWISDAIGEQEIERIRESRTTAEFPHFRQSKSYSLEREVRPLVMASEIMGLEKRHGYLKCGNLVVPFSLPYIKLPVRESAYIERPAAVPPKKERKTAEQLSLPYATPTAGVSAFVPHPEKARPEESPKTLVASAGAEARTGKRQKIVPHEQSQKGNQKIDREPVRSKEYFFE
jgi:hypothetical protein